MFVFITSTQKVPFLFFKNDCFSGTKTKAVVGGRLRLLEFYALKTKEGGKERQSMSMVYEYVYIEMY